MSTPNATRSVPPFFGVPALAAAEPLVVAGAAAAAGAAVALGATACGAQATPTARVAEIRAVVRRNSRRVNLPIVRPNSEVAIRLLPLTDLPPSGRRQCTGRSR